MLKSTTTIELIRARTGWCSNKRSVLHFFRTAVQCCCIVPDRTKWTNHNVPRASCLHQRSCWVQPFPNPELNETSSTTSKTHHSNSISQARKTRTSTVTYWVIRKNSDNNWSFRSLSFYPYIHTSKGEAADHIPNPAFCGRKPSLARGHSPGKGRLGTGDRRWGWKGSRYRHSATMESLTHDFEVLSGNDPAVDHRHPAPHSVHRWTRHSTQLSNTTTKKEKIMKITTTNFQYQSSQLDNTSSTSVKWTNMLCHAMSCHHITSYHGPR